MLLIIYAVATENFCEGAKKWSCVVVPAWGIRVLQVTSVGKEAQTRLSPTAGSRTLFYNLPSMTSAMDPGVTLERNTAVSRGPD
jgi:hypothetical protein